MNTVTKLTQIFTVTLILGSTLNSCTSGETRQEKVLMRERPDCTQANVNYAGNRSPLRPMNFIKLPVGAIQPEGWLKKYLNLQKEGLTGHLGEISAWLAKDNNAWLTNGGDHGWEEVPYWLKGYGNMAYILKDEKMINETKTWIEGVFRSQQPNGYFGPVNTRNGKPELWAQMIMLWCLQSYYEYSQDERVINLMTNYFKWQMTIPDEQFLEDYWENSRGGDNLLSVYWLYNRTGDRFLLKLAEKIHRNTADWTRPSTLPNWHNVNIAQCFREPASYYMLTGDSTLLQASYNVHNLIRRTFGQVPGGMFGADENARMGYIDPRQGVETCGIQYLSGSCNARFQSIAVYHLPQSHRKRFGKPSSGNRQQWTFPCHEPVQQPLLPTQPCTRVALLQRASDTGNSRQWSRYRIICSM